MLTYVRSHKVKPCLQETTPCPCLPESAAILFVKSWNVGVNKTDRFKDKIHAGMIFQAYRFVYCVSLYLPVINCRPYRPCTREFFTKYIKSSIHPLTRNATEAPSIGNSCIVPCFFNWPIEKSADTKCGDAASFRAECKLGNIHTFAFSIVNSEMVQVPETIIR